MTRSYLKICSMAAGIGAGLGVFLTSPAAYAVPVTTTVQGSVDLADASNPFGLSAGDVVTAIATYDDAGIPAVGASNLAFDSDPTFSLTITFGNFTFEASDDDDFGSGFPRFQFSDGALTGIEFERDGFAFGGFTDLTVGEFTGQTQWFLEDNIGSVEVLLEGTWDFANAVTEPNDAVVVVSEPGSLLLFAAGFIGLCGYSRRRRRLIQKL
ncbi:PEP-CTERM sorting domain-containing protein [Denitrobaculum tricleocarpae]|uniref:PEP-CTERM sorting domain-containing protein n=1 Tax=Denitrobaculum tricleocarpae TaxID=2591009 RepID=A0A545TB56_9PROT|nr:PEP-CTERM sorting domain-containing protein [Denitrobaculum tricleocarpae]TQV74442.1 PEP-CTERM sorting domain-containing protein [Denitrobaculum tricleocarpae]